MPKTQFKQPKEFEPKPQLVDHELYGTLPDDKPILNHKLERITVLGRKTHGFCLYKAPVKPDYEYEPTPQTFVRNDNVRTKFHFVKGNPPLGISDLEWDKKFNTVDSQIHNYYCKIMKYQKVECNALREEDRQYGVTRTAAILILRHEEKLSRDWKDGDDKW